MKEVNEIIQELNEWGSPLAAMPRTMPYSVPDGYFDQLPGDIWGGIADEQLMLEFDGTDMPLQAPEGYFDSLPLKMLQAAKAGDVREQETTAVPARQIKLRPYIRWAAAAVIAITVSIGGYLMYAPQETTPERILSSIPKSELKEYVTRRYGLDPAMIAPGKEVNNLNVNNKDIVEYLDATGWD